MIKSKWCFLLMIAFAITLCTGLGVGLGLKTVASEPVYDLKVEKPLSSKFVFEEIDEDFEKVFENILFLDFSATKTKYSLENSVVYEIKFDHDAEMDFVEILLEDSFIALPINKSILVGLNWIKKIFVLNLSLI